MFDAAPVLASMAPEPARRYHGPERRAGSPPVARWLTMMLDEIDYGMLLLTNGTEVTHLNHVARADLDAGGPLQLAANQLRTRDPAEGPRLLDAVVAAAQRGLRRLLALGEGTERRNLAVIPLGGQATLVVLGRRQLSQRISVQCYARLHGLTMAEARVLEGLCEGLDPREIAELNDVGLATVRTQISNIRAKTGAPHIRELVRQVAVLPPMMAALRV